MYARIWDFIQRTKRTIGYPFIFGRQHTTFFTSSSGLSSSHSSDERLIISPVQPCPSEPSAESSGSILEHQRSAAPRLRPSTQGSSEPPQSFRDARENLQDGVQFTDSPSRIIVHNDGSAVFYALLLNEGLVAKQREIIKCCRMRSHLNRKLGAVQMEVLITEGNLRYSKASIEETGSDKRSTAIEDLKLKQQKSLSVSQKRDVLREDLHILELKLEYLRNQSQRMFEDALSEANMLNLPELDDDSITNIQDPTEHDQTSAAISIQSSSTGISMEHTFHLALVEEMEKKKMIFYRRRDAFERGSEDLAKELEDYEQAVQDGTCDLPQTDFDCMGVEMLQARTKEYIDAEIAYEEVKTRARALGLLDNEFEQESNFIDHPDDGYRESHEVVMTATVNGDGIEEWKAQVIDSQDIESLDVDLEADDWEAKSIGISDSISLVDYTRNGTRIDRWQEICRLAREEDVENSADFI